MINEWEQFFATGKVEDYLSAKRVERMQMRCGDKQREKEGGGFRFEDGRQTAKEDGTDAGRQSG